MITTTTRKILARDLPLEKRINFSIHTRHALVNVTGKGSFDGEHLWIFGSDTTANSVMINGDTEIEFFELTYEDGSDTVVLASHTAMDGFIE